MPWLVRCVPTSLDEEPLQPDLLDRHAVLVSALWDLGTSGVAEQSASLVAGFEELDTARAAAHLARRHGLVADVEAVDDSWVHRETVDVDLTTAVGSVRFPIVAHAAFGHGGHPTTRLCLALMSRVLVDVDQAAAGVASRRRVLDLGTGSGVLAIAAHRLGASDVTALDVDPAALDSARFNAAANRVDLQLVLGDIRDVAGTRFDLIVANVLLVTHEEVAAATGSVLAPDGVLVVAGFLTDQVDRVVAAYRSGRPTLDVIDRMFLNEWCGLVLADPATTR